jgi:hypothetical protein
MTGKIIAAGCSFSDYLDNNRTVYGQALAELLGWQYLHQGAGSGSNWRIWRCLAQMVISGEITDQDIVIVQYTGLERREFWSQRRSPPPEQGLNVRDPGPEGGDLIRYKAWAWTWMDHSIENKFLKIYEENFVSLEYERSWFVLQHLQFQLLLREYGIRTVFIDGRHTPRPLSLIPPFEQCRWTEPLDFCADSQWDNQPGDNSHLNDAGHQRMAELLKQHIMDLGW